MLESNDINLIDVTNWSGYPFVEEWSVLHACLTTTERSCINHNQMFALRVSPARMHACMSPTTC